MGQHSGDLTRSGQNYSLVSKLLKTLDRKICVNCNRITMRCTEKGFCDKCDEMRPLASKIIMDLTRCQRDESTEDLKSIQKTKFGLRRITPRNL